MSDSVTPKDSVVVERIFDAPTALVWKMWTDPDHFKRWYGPQGFTVPAADLDVHVGGKRLVCMASPDGSKQMWTTGEHREIVPDKRLVYTESPSDEQGNVLSPAAMGMPEGFPMTTVVTVLLKKVDGRTQMTLTHAGVPSSSGASGGWNQAFDKMAAYMDTAVNPPS